MKCLTVILGVMIVTACGGEPGDAGDSDEALASDSVTSSLELLRHGHGDVVGARAVHQAIGRGAARLADLQADTIGDNARNGVTDADPDDSGWDFTLPASATSHTATASPANLFGETALGAWAAAVSRLAGTRALVTAIDAGTGMQRNPDVDSPPDFIFGVLLAELADNPGFAQVAKDHYDARLAHNGGAAGFAQVISDARHASNEDGLIPYDVGWMILSAAALDAAFPHAGYAADADTFAGFVVDDLNATSPRFDLRDRTEGFYVIGLGWSQVAAAFVGDRALLGRARTRLLDEQRSDGAWGTTAGPPEVDLQSTGIALETIALTDRATVRSRLAVRRATGFLVHAQAASGGWPDASQIDAPLVDAEIIVGLMLARTAAGQDGLVPESPFLATLPAAVAAVPHAVPHAVPLP